MKYIITAILAFILGVVMGYNGCSKQNTIVTDTVYQHDTIKEPMPYDSVIVRHKIQKLPIVKHDTVNNTDTVYHTDSVTVEIPIAQKIYRDSNYVAWVSGYEAKLDSISVTTKIVTRTKTETIYKAKRFGLGVQTGFDLIGRKPYIGVGVSWNLWSFKRL